MNIELLRKIDRIHPYPAKYPIELAIKYISQYTKDGDLIYDPFIGSGTTLLASNALNRRGIGTDINYIAILISQFKLLYLADREINVLENFINEFRETYKSEIEEITPYYYKSIEHWFCDDSIKVLSLIKSKVDNLNEKEQIFCKTIMSTIINSVSNQESDTRYAAISKPHVNMDYVANAFIKKFDLALSIIKEYNDEFNFVENIPYLLDSRDCDKIISKNSVDLILTSPPYINTYDYYLYHKHRMNWLGFNVKYSMEAEIGSRREYSSLKKPQSKFNDDLFEIFKKCNYVLKDNGTVVIVIGDGKISGEIYDAKENLLTIADKIGWKQIDYSYTNLDDTSRAFQKSYRTKGKKEHIITFRKKMGT